MIPRITIEDRLVIFAQGGMTKGFTLKIWKNKVKHLEKEGIKLKNPQPTGKKGLSKYEVDFSEPVPDTFSEKLFDIAVENGYKEDRVPVPYSY